jgi:OB-fold nucleic acid binding domain
VTTTRQADELVVLRAADAAVRDLVQLTGRVTSLSARDTPVVHLDVVVEDPTGSVRCTFFGRRGIPGVTRGTRLRVEGRLVIYQGRRCLLNPAYELLSATCTAPVASS